MFLLEYFKNPRCVGAIMKSSKYLSSEMVRNINFKNSKVIIEYGPGTGVFSDEILKLRNINTLIILIEINKKFFEILKKKYEKEKNIIILNESVENIDNILKRYYIENVDYIISGLPFASLPKDVSEKILKKTSIIIGISGTFITFQYSLIKKQYLEKFFCEINYRKVLMNFPPAYVLECIGGKYEK